MAISHVFNFVPSFSEGNFYTLVSHMTKTVLSAGCSFHYDNSLRVELGHASSVTNSLFFCFYRMSSVDVNDENRGVCPGGKHSSSSNDIFALDQPTGRPSILRQTENLPSKTVPKGTKVQNRLLLIVYSVTNKPSLSTAIGSC